MYTGFRKAQKASIIIIIIIQTGKSNQTNKVQHQFVDIQALLLSWENCLSLMPVLLILKKSLTSAVYGDKCQRQGQMSTHN